MKKFDALTPIGLVLGLAMVGLGIMSNGGFSGVTAFIDPASMFIVLGGLAAGLLINFTLGEMKLLLKIFGQTFNQKETDLKDLIQMFVNLSDRARREGLLALEAELDNIDDPFIKKGILLAVDGVEPEVLNDILNADIAAMEDRHKAGKNIMDKAGEFAPAWGMIGTLVGLVLMLRSLDDPSTLGPKMAVALITTLYGSLIANLVFIPMAGKLAIKTEKEVFIKQVIIEGIIGVQSGQNPKILEEKLNAFLPSEQRNAEGTDDGMSVGDAVNES